MEQASAPGTYSQLAASLLALFAVALEAWRPQDLPDAVCTLLAFVSLLVSVTLWSRRPAGGAMLATFLPAIPLAAAVQLLQGGHAGASAFAATALAFQLRCLLLSSAATFQSRREKSGAALQARLPAKVTVFVDNDIDSDVALSALREGHLFRVAPGQVIAADGLVTFGSGFVDESFEEGALENLRMKGMGSQVFAGTLNKNGILLVRATSVGSQTFLCRLAQRARLGTEASTIRLLGIDAVLTLAAVGLLLPSGPQAALRAFLAASGVSVLAALASFEHGLMSVGIARRWLWSPGGLRRLSLSGMLTFRSEGVLSEGRPRLVAVECGGQLSEDAVLGMLAPLARKLESAAAFAVLQELRLRNIPLQPVEFYQPLADGGSGIVANDEVRWVSQALGRQELDGGALQAFVREHLAAGDELHFLEREGRLEAALAFRDNPVAGAAESVEELRAISLPILLVSNLSKRTVSRLQSELSLEHAQGEANEAETESLLARLRDEGLAPAWVQTGSFRPASFAALAALPQAAPERCDLVALDLTLPSLARALSFGRSAFRRLRTLEGWLFGCQLAALASLLASDARLCALLGFGNLGTMHLAAFAFLATLPGFLALFFASPELS